jgi:hypothetical protein
VSAFSPLRGYRLIVRPHEPPLATHLEPDRWSRMLRAAALAVAVVGALVIVWGVAFDERPAPTADDLASDIAGALGSGPDLIGDMTACTRSGPERWTCTVADPQSSGSVDVTAVTDNGTLTWDTCWKARRTQPTNEGQMPKTASGCL